MNASLRYNLLHGSHCDCSGCGWNGRHDFVSTQIRGGTQNARCKRELIIRIKQPNLFWSLPGPVTCFRYGERSDAAYAWSSASTGSIGFIERRTPGSNIFCAPNMAIGFCHSFVQKSPHVFYIKASSHIAGGTIGMANRIFLFLWFIMGLI